MQEGQEIFAATNNHPERKFQLGKLVREKIKEQSYLFYASAKGFGPHDTKNLALQFYPISSITKEEMEFITNTQRYQNSKKKPTCPSNFVSILDTFEYDKKYFTVIYEKGEVDLYQLLSRNQQKIDDEQKLKICLDIAYSIYYLHQNELVYLNLKPEKYQKCGDSFKLTDIRNVKKRMSEQTFQLSTPLLSIPEMKRNSQNYLENANIWIIGCLFYEVINGKTLFNYKTKNVIIEASQDYQKYLSYINDQINLLNCQPKFKQLLIAILDQRQSVSAKFIVETLNKIICPNNNQTQQFDDDNEQQEQFKQQCQVQQFIENQIKEKSAEMEKQLKCQIFQQYQSMQNENQLKMQQLIKEFKSTQLQIEEGQQKLKVQFNDHNINCGKELNNQNLEMEKQLKCEIAKQHQQAQDEQQSKLQLLKQDLQKTKSEIMLEQKGFQNQFNNQNKNLEKNMENLKNQLQDLASIQTQNQQKLNQELQSAKYENKSAVEIALGKLNTQTSTKMQEILTTLDSLNKRIYQLEFQQKQTEIQTQSEPENDGTIQFYVYLIVFLIVLKLVLS